MFSEKLEKLDLKKLSFKKVLSFVLAITILFATFPVLNSNASAEVLSYDGLYYEKHKDYDWKTGEYVYQIAITGVVNTVSGSIIIPSTIEGLPVTSIGNYAFYGCSSLTSITIPDGVTSIGSSAFKGCSSLTSITIPDSVTSIDDYAFKGCSSLTSITIPDSVTIGNQAFYNTAYYNDISNWNNNVLYIGNHLIKAKSSIKGSYKIKDGTKTIGGGAFEDGSSLTSITIPDSVTSIGDRAFEYCSSLTSITIPDSVTSIVNYTETSKNLV